MSNQELNIALYKKMTAEQDTYRAYVTCKETIEAAISAHYTNNRLGKEAALEVIEAFGMERTMYVLANTVWHEDWDGRISLDKTMWAITIPAHADRNHWGDDRKGHFVLITKDEDRSQPLRKLRRSVRKDLQKTSAKSAPAASKKHKQEREAR